MSSTGGGLDLQTLDILLQRIRRHPQDRAARLKAVDAVAALADHIAPPGEDNLLADAIRNGKLLRRALARANQSDVVSDNDIAALNAWIDALHPLLLKVIERPSG
jgi:hypothetical protein